MLFTPMTQIMATSAQAQRYASVRLDGPTAAVKPRRRALGNAGRGIIRPFATRRSLAAA